MNVLKRTLRVAVAASMVGGALAAFAPDTSGAAVTTVAACSGQRAYAKAKSTFIWTDGKAAGVTDKNHDVSIGSKGIHAVGTPNVKEGGTDLGSCGFLQAVAFDKGLTKTPADTKVVNKWSAKVVSPALDCVSESTPDAAEWPAAGKLKYAFDDGLKSDAFVAFKTPSGGAADQVVLEGIITKGVGVGADVSAGITYTPVVKDKEVTVDYQGFGPDYLGKSISKDLNVNYDYPPAGAGPEDHVPPANELAAFQSYRISGTLGLAGCQATSEPGTETVNLREIYVQAGPSPLLGSSSVPNVWTIGAP